MPLSALVILWGGRHRKVTTGRLAAQPNEINELQVQGETLTQKVWSMAIEEDT